MADDKEDPAPEPISEPAVNEKKPMTRKKSSRATKVFYKFIFKNEINLYPFLPPPPTPELVTGIWKCFN